MNENEIRNKIAELEAGVNSLKDLLPKSSRPDGIQILVVLDEEVSYVHYWDGFNPEPFPLLIAKGEAPVEDVVEYTCRAFNKFGPDAFGKPIEFCSDLKWDQLPENFQKLVDVFQQIKITEPKRSLIDRIKRRQDVIHCMSTES
jgi:hypothetical protein